MSAIIKSPRVLILIFGLLLTAAIGVMVIRRGGSENLPAPVLPSSAEIISRTSGWEKGELSPPALARILEFKGAANALLGDLSREDLSEVAARASEMIGLYRSGTRQQFSDWLTANMVPVGPWADEADDWAADRWAKHRAMLEGTSAHLDGARVLLRSRNGKVVQKADSKGRSHTSMRSPSDVAANGDSDIDINSYKGMLVEVIVPMQFMDESGASFIADVGLTFGKRNDGRWIPVGAAHYGLPMGVGVPPPPL